MELELFESVTKHQLYAFAHEPFACVWFENVIPEGCALESTTDYIIDSNHADESHRLSLNNEKPVPTTVIAPFHISNKCRAGSCFGVDPATIKSATTMHRIEKCRAIVNARWSNEDTRIRHRGLVSNK